MSVLYVQWIQNLEKDNKLTVIKLTDGDYLRTLENAVQVLVEPLEHGTRTMLLTWGGGYDRCLKLITSVIYTAVCTVQYSSPASLTLEAVYPQPDEHSAELVVET